MKVIFKIHQPEGWGSFIPAYISELPRNDLIMIVQGILSAQSKNIQSFESV